ncbi:MAG: transcriptional regulator [Acetobacteraceae bacterium]
MNNRESALRVRFGRFLLDSHRRELLADGVPVPIGGRAFDILAVLVEAGGQLVTKDELLSRVWPGRFVEENSLQFQISTLRKALAHDREFIKTIAGRGYRFIADILPCVGPDAASFPRRGDSPPSAFPAALSDFIGHDGALAGLADLVTTNRLAALVEASGIGGTRQCVESSRRLLSDLANGMWVAAPVRSSNPEFVFPAVATTLRLADDGPASPEGVSAALAPNCLVLLLSFSTLAFVSQDCAFAPQDTLPVETSRSRLTPTSSATSDLTRAVM